MKFDKLKGIWTIKSIYLLVYTYSQDDSNKTVWLYGFKPIPIEAGREREKETQHSKKFFFIRLPL